MSRTGLDAPPAPRVEPAGRWRRFQQAGLALYEWLCGRHPNLRPWHFQWLAGRAIYRDFRRVLPALSGRVLDVGCGEQPYRGWLGAGVTEYVGADLASGPRVDVVLTPGEPWPIESQTFDAVLCTQVLEHVAEFDLAVRELTRVLKPGGTLIVSVPFAYNEHGVPFDFRRLSGWGVRAAFERDFDIVEVSRQGGLGTTLGTLLLNWFIIGSTTRAAVGLLMPLWIVFSLTVNMASTLLDVLDRTGAFYGNVMLVARKRASGAAAASGLAT